MRLLVFLNRKSGFTLIELMMVAAIIGMLASIAIPKFAELIVKAKESSIKGSLGALRGALTIYYADTEGTRPSAITALTTGLKYMQAIPSISIPKNTNNAGHPTASNAARANVSDAAAERWTYYAASGAVYVNCTHRDTKGSTWSTW